MKIIPFTASMIPAVTALWNEAVADGQLYKPFTPEEYKVKFLDNPHFDYAYSFVSCEEIPKDGRITGDKSSESLTGFALGVCKKTFLPGETHENTPGYITMVAVRPACRRQGIGSALLSALENAFIAAGKSKADIIFFNPINLEWVVPGTNGHEHPNTPGVKLDSPGYLFFFNRGYENIAEQNAYYRALKDLPPSGEVPKVSAILSTLQEKGITIEPYRADYHYDLDALFDNLQNEHWRHEIHTHLAAHPEWPLLVVSDQGKVAGFAGPVYPQPNGRGFFSGIGVHSGYGGMGIGTALFYRLCETEKERGAVYMTLFTGVNNPARKLYESAGFVIAAQWADMRRFL